MITMKGRGMGVHMTYIPDCPECGTECREMGRNVGKSYGIDERFWECPYCGWESESVEEYGEFQRLTERLTEPMRNLY